MKNKTTKKFKKNKEVQKAALQFIEDCATLRLSRNLRKILLDYISQNKDCLPVDFDVYLYDFNMLFDFLEVIFNEQSR